MRDVELEVEQALLGRKGRKRGDEIDFCCVAHEDDNPSAGWNRKKGAWHCVVCGQGGSTLDLAGRLGIEVERPRERAEKARIVATYDYRGEQGELLYQVVRYEPKTFKQRRPDGHGGWTWDMRGVAMVPYRLPELLASKGPVFIPEGERDADCLHTHGLTATTSAGGAVGRDSKGRPGRQKWRPERYNRYLNGREIVLLPDNDTPGEDYAAYVATSLRGASKSVKVLRLPGLPPKGDVSDWFAQGGTVDELLALVADCPEWEPPKEPTGIAAFALTDAGNAELFAELYGDRVRYDHARGRWLLWDRHRWQQDPDGGLYRLAKEAARRRAKEAADLDGGHARAMFAWAKKSESSGAIEACLKLARAETPLADSGQGWDANPLALGLENGVANLTAGAVHEGRIEERITMSCGIVHDPQAKCPVWLGFLESVFEGDEEVIAFIQRAVGYSLTGSVAEQVWFLCHGSGANGKSTFVDVLTALLGEYAGDTPADTLCARGSLNSGSASPDVAALNGKRFITCSETEEMAKLSAGRVKWLTGGNPVTARQLYRDPVTFQPQFKLWLTTNHLPRVDDDSEGFWRRVRLIPFERKFEGAERDGDMEKKLKAELPGILNWALQGAVAWHKQGLAAPDSVMLATLNYRQASDPLAEFISDCCVVGENCRATRGQLYGAYEAWAKAQGFRERDMLGARSFGRRIDERWPNVKMHGARVYRGVGLRSVESGDVTEPSGRYSDSADTKTGNFASSIASRGATFENNVPNVPYVPRCDCDEKHTTERACQDELYWQDEDDNYHCPICHPDPREESL